TVYVVSGFIVMLIPNCATSQNLVILVICYITAWKVFGYNFITLYAAVASISEEIIENARLDNVPTWRLFLDIVLPMSSSASLFILIITIFTGIQYVFTIFLVVNSVCM